MLVILENTLNAAKAIARSQALEPHQWQFVTEHDMPHRLSGVERGTIVILHTACYGEIVDDVLEWMASRDVALIAVACPTC